MRSLVVLGSTGSIGESTLKVVEALPQQLRVVGLAVHSNVERVIEQARHLGVKVVAVADMAAAKRARQLVGRTGIEVWEGAHGVAAMAAFPSADTTLCALVGLAGLRPTLAAIDAGKDVALANKETLVAAGELVMRRRALADVNILPVDSEHSAIFQCLQATGYSVACTRGRRDNLLLAAEECVANLTLTASGGPFATTPACDFTRVTPEQALAHPRWSMGRKVTIDSATMMNKGLELMEAHWLYKVPPQRIKVLVHPESIVHSLVTFTDGTQMAQLSLPDMRFPIQYALTWPRRRATVMPQLNLAELGRLTFMEPDEARFPALRLAREAAIDGGTLPTVLNAADEVAVAAFLAGRLSFAGIWQSVEKVMLAHDVRKADTLESIEAADAWARACAEDFCKRTR